MHIGLIGGIGPAATDYYYRGLIRHAAASGRDLDLTIVHADAPTLLSNLQKDDRKAQVAIYERLTTRLRSAGAECVVVTSIAGHFCIDEFTEVSVLPVVDLTQALTARLGRDGLSRVGILGTNVVMTSGMYGKLAPVEVLAPEGDALDDVHNAYVSLAQSGLVRPEHQTTFFSAGRAMMDRGAQAVLLGGTDINGAFDGGDCGFPVVDCAGIHVDDIAQRI